MSTIPLAELLHAPRPAAQEVAWSRRRRETRASFLGRVAAVAARIADNPSGRWLLDVGDACDFAVGLFGVARAGGRAVVPANRQAGTVRALLQSCDGALADADSYAAHADAPVIQIPELRPVPAPPVHLDPRDPLLSLFTSGTTGAAREIPKSLAQLDEVRVLEQALGADLPADTRVLASAPHQHLYGMLFRVLWPLAAGRPFHSQTCLHPEELLPDLAGGHSVLVATPAQLRRLAVRPELPGLRGLLLRVFCSGGPLNADTAASLAGDLGSPPIEILGSTETGGIALRQQGTGAAGSFSAWRPLPGVEVQQETGSGRLLVTSPFVSVGSPAPDPHRMRFALGDRIQPQPSGDFLLLDRSDRVVKVGERRLSLPEMERRLREHPFVEDASLLLLDHGVSPRVAAVVIASPAGAEALASEGRRTVTRALALHLTPWWDRVLLPRSWRFPAELPHDERGKVPQAALRPLFERGGARPREPWHLDEQRSRDKLVRQLAVPANLAQLEGHYEGFPVVPGVVQLGWALDAAAALLGRAPVPECIEALKFPALLRPGDRVRLELCIDSERTRARFRLTELADASRVFASGRCQLEHSA